MTAPLRAAAGLVALLLVLGACDGMPGKPDPADRYVAPRDVLDFDTLYATHCAGCHGASGTHGPARPLADRVYLAFAGRKVLTDVIAKGVPGTLMPGFEIDPRRGLAPAQVTALVEGMIARWGGPTGDGALPAYAVGDVDTSAAAVERGRRAYATFCASCHGEDGAEVTDASYLALVSDQALRTAVVCGRVDLGMPDWRADVEGRAMTDAEIADVTAWLVSQRKPFPGQPYPADDP